LILSLFLNVHENEREYQCFGDNLIDLNEVYIKVQELEK